MGESVGLGLLISTGASLINVVVGLLLLCTGRRHRSIVLEAGKDPLIALAVAANIVYTGIGLLRRSIGGLMDRALPESEQVLIREVLQTRQRADVQFHDVRTRQAGQHGFISLCATVPGDWTVRRGHD
ncbi:MAG: cation diffusion facilitator family transporter, partial [Pseudonocardiaceae bacterium]